MKFLFTAPRFHTNQVPIVKGLMEKGHEVRYFVAFEGATENHRFCKPVVLKRTKYSSKKDPGIAAFFVPDMAFLREKFEAYSPDVVICRENTPLTLCVNALCREHGVPCIMYDQQPYLIQPDTKDTANPPPVRRSLLERIHTKLYRKLNPDQRMLARLRATSGYPTVRMTTVLLSVYSPDTSHAKPEKRSYFIPFVGEVQAAAENRTYMPDGKLRILCVGKYREYKNLPLFIEAMALLKEKDKIQVTILGQAVSVEECAYCQELTELAARYGLGETIIFEKNIPHECMDTVYLRHDLLVLPTKRECASIAVIEAMAHGLAVISTDHNGTATYIEPGTGGFVFETQNAASLAEQIEKYIQGVSVEEHGKAAYANIKQKYAFENYYLALRKMLMAEFSLQL